MCEKGDFLIKKMSEKFWSKTKWFPKGVKNF